MKSIVWNPFWQRTFLPLILVFSIASTVIVSADFTTCEVQSTEEGWCGNGYLLNRNPQLIARWMTIREHGWPLKTLETYQTEWDGGVDSRGQPVVVTDQMKSLDRMARRSEHSRYQVPAKKFQDWKLRTYDPYRPASDFPYESGTNLYPSAVFMNFALGTIALVAIWAFVSVSKRSAIKYLQSSRRRGGLCARCKYDMRGSINSGRCPECGTPWAADSMATAPPHSQPLIETATKQG